LVESTGQGTRGVRWWNVISLGYPFAVRARDPVLMRS